MSEKIALERIEKAAKENADILDLSSLRLQKLPIEIGELKNLKTLYLALNDLSELPSEIGKLVNLTYLNIRFNQINSISPEIGRLGKLRELIASGNFLTSIPNEITQLKELRNLDLGSNLITTLPSTIGELSNLEGLSLGNYSLTTNLIKGNYVFNTGSKFDYLYDLGIRNKHFKTRVNKRGNKLIELPLELFNLKNLKALYLAGNKLRKISDEIFSIKKLVILDVAFNELTSIPDQISNLPDIAILGLSSNQLKYLPSSLRNNTSLRILDIRKNPIDLPLEISERIFEPKIILNYYVHLSDNGRPIYEVKLLFVGQGSVGKTSVIRQISNGDFDKQEIKTEGISITKWSVDNQLNAQQVKINLNIWDFGGQEIMHATHQFFLTKRSLYLLVLDSRLTQEENRIEYWLKIIQSFGGESPVLVVGNKTDQQPLDIDRTGLQKKYPNIVGILETSAATGAGIEELKTAIAEQVNNLPHVRDLLPETWFTVKTKLEEIGREKNYISQEKYLDLCAENEVTDETSQRTLIGFLHDLGVVLHFQDDPRLEALGILNPQWVTNGVYKILNSHTLFQNKGVLTVSMLDEILNLPEYPRGKRLFIVDMMKKFELCYDIEADKTFLVPDLLPKDEPAELKFNGVPAFEYAYPVLPSSVITRFIVRMNQKIDDGLVWRTGVVLKIGENTALVKADIEDRKITIAIDGVEHTRRDALSAIRFQLDEIHNSIKGLDAQKRVPIPEAPNAEPLDYDYLLQLERDGFDELPVKNGDRLVKVNVRKLLSGVVSETERRQSAGNTTNIYVGGDISGGNIISGNENQAKAEVSDKKPKKKN